jgi:16S rRNA (cytosine967-C5)-methyltransferase
VRLGPSSVRLPAGGGVEALPGFAEGAWWVQDLAATLPVAMLAPKPGEAIADLCAAPGGKTLQLAAAGAQVTAVDRSGPRLVRLQENLARTGLAAQRVVADVAAWEPPERFDAVLLDAPCTATGTLRRHPEGAWIKRPDDVPALCAVQRDLARAAARLLKPGGRMVYAVCSLEPEEGPAQADWVARELGLERRPVQAGDLNLPGEVIDAEGALRTRPSMLSAQGGIDGFFAALFVKPL